ncbi:MAG: hypothetical protein ACYC7E_07610 [Armatimonadota bacterium]
MSTIAHHNLSNHRPAIFVGESVTFRLFDVVEYNIRSKRILLQGATGCTWVTLPHRQELQRFMAHYDQFLKNAGD